METLKALLVIVVLWATPRVSAKLGPRLPVSDMSDLVVSNTSTLNMRSASAGDTGWMMKLEVAFTRDPPIYGDGDESVGIDSTLMVYPGANAQRKPPMHVGTVVTIRPRINGIQTADIQLVPLVPIADGANSLSTFHHCSLGMEILRIKGVVSQSVTVQIELVDMKWGTLSSQVSLLMTY